MQGQQRFARAKTLGYYYIPENIQRRIRQFSSHKKMIDDYLVSLRDEPECKRKKGELE